MKIGNHFTCIKMPSIFPIRFWKIWNYKGYFCVQLIRFSIIIYFGKKIIQIIYHGCWSKIYFDFNEYFFLHRLIICIKNSISIHYWVNSYKFIRKFDLSHNRKRWNFMIGTETIKSYFFNFGKHPTSLSGIICKTFIIGSKIFLFFLFNSSRLCLLNSSYLYHVVFRKSKYVHISISYRIRYDTNQLCTQFFVFGFGFF